MFKRLAKSKRHSIEGLGVESRVATPTSSSIGSPAAGSTATLDLPCNVGAGRAPRAKQARRSCGDQPLSRVAIQPLDEELNDDDDDDDDDAGDDEDDNSDPLRIARVNSEETDYQMVTAVPAYIVEHEPEKQKGLGVWGRRMSKKIDSFRRSSSRDSPPDGNEKPKTQTPDARRFSSPQQRSASPFKSFFIRIGSTGMLNSAKGSRRPLQTVEDRQGVTKFSPKQATFQRTNRSPEKDQTPLFRSCSTSQLNMTLTYVKGDDPSEGIDLRIGGKDCKTVSCDNLAGQLLDDVFEPATSPNPGTFYGCDFVDGSRSDANRVRKSVSCEFRDVPRESKDSLTKKSNFPYAFLRSKLSVLPEERHAGSAKQSSELDRIFKTASEEHFPSLLRVEDGTETTTLGRRRSRPTGASCFRVGARNSYSEYRSPSYDQEHRGSPASSTPAALVRDRVDFAAASLDYAELDAAAATLRSQRRNSAPSAEQRLSSHYVSSNESGYDSDGPRGESAATSETEAMSLNRADSSDTGSVVDSEIEKPTRSSTPSEYAEQSDAHSHLHHHHQHHHHHHHPPPHPQQTENNNLEGLRWHQTTSGRVLPSINQTTNNAADHREEKREADALPHRIKLQLEKTRFLTDIIHPEKRVLRRRCRLVNLTKTDPSESLGIRLAQQRGENSLRYVVVELENKGIAHRDGRLRLGDEIVEVEGRDLGTLESLQAVQDFLGSFRGSRIQLLTSYEENVPQISAGSLGILPGETEYFENAKTLSNISLQENKRVCGSVERRKRPDNLPLSVSSSSEVLLEAHRYLTRHTARFEKGYGKPSLGFSVVGGRDSPRGEMGIFVRRVFPGGQADVSKSLLQGDEILTLNSKILRGFTHREVIELFKAVREGPVELEVARRHRYPKSTTESATY